MKTSSLRRSGSVPTRSYHVSQTPGDHETRGDESAAGGGAAAIRMTQRPQLALEDRGFCHGIHVENLPTKLTTLELMNMFDKFGPVLEIKRSATVDTTDGSMTGQAIVRYKSAEQASSALLIKYLDLLGPTIQVKQYAHPVATSDIDGKVLERLHLFTWTSPCDSELQFAAMVSRAIIVRYVISGTKPHEFDFFTKAGTILLLEIQPSLDDESKSSMIMVYSSPREALQAAITFDQKQFQGSKLSVGLVTNPRLSVKPNE